MISSQKFAYTNSTETALRLSVEPWADQYIVQSGMQVDVVVRGDTTNGCLEIEQHPGGLTIYGYEGCIISLSSDGKSLVPAMQK